MSSRADEVKKVIAKLSQHEIDEITDDKHVFNDLHIDSLRAAELLSRLSQKYDIFIPDEKAMEMMTVGDIMRVLNEMIEEKQGKGENA